MSNFKIGDIVARKSYNYDVLFRITNIHPDGLVDLVGITVRIIADAQEYDLKLIDKNELDFRLKNIEKSRRIRMDRSCSSLKYKTNKYYNYRDNIYMMQQTEKYKRFPARVLHIDGDSGYCVECKKIYKKMGINSAVVNIEEREQYRQVVPLLQKYRPEILILTGHDAFIKRRNDIYNVDNYKNSRYFIQAVIEARKYEHSLDDLVIFAGACQSYYEALINVGANFASAPKRVLIDMTDPMIVAENVAFTPVNEFVSLENIITNTREGINGIGGIQTRGQLRYSFPNV